jgi:hypothetical protein
MVEHASFCCGADHSPKAKNDADTNAAPEINAQATSTASDTNTNTNTNANTNTNTNTNTSADTNADADTNTDTNIDTDAIEVEIADRHFRRDDSIIRVRDGEGRHTGANR